MSSPPEEVSLADAAIALKVPYRRAYDLALAGALGPPRRVGQRLFIERRGLELFAASVAPVRATPAA